MSSSQSFANLSDSKLSVSASLHCINTVNVEGNANMEKGVSNSGCKLEYENRVNELKDGTTNEAVLTPVGRLKIVYEHKHDQALQIRY